MHFKSSGASHDPLAQLHLLLRWPLHIDCRLIHDHIHLEPSIGTPPTCYISYPPQSQRRGHHIKSHATDSKGKKNYLFMFWRMMIGPHSRFSANLQLSCMGYRCSMIKEGMTTIKLCKSTPDGFDCRKYTYCRFESSVNGIFMGEMRDNQFSVPRIFLSSQHLASYLSMTPFPLFSHLAWDPSVVWSANVTVTIWLLGMSRWSWRAITCTLPPPLQSPYMGPKYSMVSQRYRYNITAKNE